MAAARAGYEAEHPPPGSAYGSAETELRRRDRTQRLICTAEAQRGDPSIVQPSAANRRPNHATGVSSAATIARSAIPCTRGSGAERARERRSGRPDPGGGARPPTDEQFHVHRRVLKHAGVDREGGSKAEPSATGRDRPRHPTTVCQTRSSSPRSMRRPIASPSWKWRSASARLTTATRGASQYRRGRSPAPRSGGLPAPGTCRR